MMCGMLYQIISLLLEVATGILAGACLLRLYMQHQRIAMSARSGNPLGGFQQPLAKLVFSDALKQARYRTGEGVDNCRVILCPVCHAVVIIAAASPA